MRSEREQNLEGFRKLPGRPGLLLRTTLRRNSHRIPDLNQQRLQIVRQPEALARFRLKAGSFKLFSGGREALGIRVHHLTLYMEGYRESLSRRRHQDVLHRHHHAFGRGLSSFFKALDGCLGALMRMGRRPPCAFRMYSQPSPQFNRSKTY